MSWVRCVVEHGRHPVVVGTMMVSRAARRSSAIILQRRQGIVAAAACGTCRLEEPVSKGLTYRTLPSGAADVLLVAMRWSGVWLDVGPAMEVCRILPPAFQVFREVQVNPRRLIATAAVVAKRRRSPSKSNVL